MNIFLSFLRSVRYQSFDSFGYLVSKKPPKFTLADEKLVAHRTDYLLQFPAKSFRLLAGTRFLLPTCFNDFQCSQHALSKCLCRIGKVLRHVHANYSSPLDVESMADEASMSLSAFHHHFKAVTSCSPLQYLKTIRLHQARLLMVHEGMGASTAAQRVGYESPSQFSREFKRLFGANPSTEAARVRAAL